MGLADRSRAPPALRRAALDRPRRDPRARVARAPRLPVVRLRRAAPRPRRDGGGAGGRRRAPRSGRAPRRSSRSSRTGWSPGAVVRRDGGAPSRSGRSTSSSPTARTPASGGRSAPPATATYPLGMAIRGYFTSPYHDEPWIESHLDLRDRDGNHLPGYGWIFPVGDGTVNVGVGLLSTFSGWKSINTSTLMDAFVATAPARWGISPGDVVRCAHRRQAPDRRVGHAQRRAHVAGRRRRRRLGEPVQRRGHLASRTRPGAWPPSAVSAAHRRPATASRSQRYPRAARGDVRPLLEGGARVRAGDRQPGGDARAHAGRDAVAHR